MQIQRQQRRKISAQVVEIVGEIAVAAFVGLIFAWMVVNWLMGCGESYPTADGSLIMGECLSLLPWRW